MRTTPYKLYDGDGLFLLLKPSGSRLWRLESQFNGREKLIGLGRYPEVSLKEARERRDEAQRILWASVDPAEKRKAERLALPDTFEAIAREHLTLKSNSLNARTHALKTARLDSASIFPRIGTQPITKVTAVQLLSALRAIEERGLHETAHRVRAQCSEVFQVRGSNWPCSTRRGRRSARRVGSGECAQPSRHHRTDEDRRIVARHSRLPRAALH